MKNIVVFCCLALAFVFITSCEKKIRDNVDQKSFNHEKNPNLNSLKSGGIIVYTPLCGDIDEATLSATSWDPDSWDFYSFDGNAGDDITITIEGQNGAVIANLFFGTAVTTAGVTWYDGGPDMTWIMHICWFYAPPVIVDGLAYTFNYTLEETGTYTLGIMSEGGTEYTLLTEGISCDSDGDGCPDSEDAVVNSNMEEFVEIDGCSYGVPNRMTLGEPCGTMMSDIIDDLETGDYKNHGEFVKEIAKLTEMWMEEGLITQEEKDLIVMCAAESNIGKKNQSP